MSRCELHAANGMSSECIEGECPYWRAVGHLDIGESAAGCAIQYFELLGEPGDEIAGWLLSVRERVEALEPDDSACESA